MTPPPPGHRDAATRRATYAVLALVCTMFVVVGAGIGIILWQARADAVQRGEQRAAAAAQTVAAHMQWLHEASLQALRRIDDTIGFRPELMNGMNLPGIGSAIDGLPPGVDARVFDADGNQLFSTRSGTETGVSDRQYFVALRDGQSTVVTPVLVDRFTGDTGFIIARRLVRGGDFIGIAAILIPNSLLDGFWTTLDLGDNSTIAVLRDDGWIVARYPHISKSMDLSAQPLFTKYLKLAPYGVFDSRSGLIDRVPRLIGYTRVTGAPLLATASVARVTALHAYDERAWATLLVALPVLLTLAGFAIWVARLLVADTRRRGELEDAAEQNRLMLREVHHRVKNNLQTVASLVRLRPLPPDAKRDLTTRIAAMAAVHDQIYKSDRFGDVSLGSYLRALGEDLRVAYGGDRTVIDYRLAPVTIDQERAMILGLVTTEIVSNSLRQGFAKGSRDGTIRMDLVRDGETYRLTMSDDGEKFDPKAQDGGLGLRLIHGMVLQLGGTFTLDGADGLRFSLDFPVRSPLVVSPATGRA